MAVYISCKRDAGSMQGMCTHDKPVDSCAKCALVPELFFCEKCGVNGPKAALKSHFNQYNSMDITAPWAWDRLRQLPEYPQIKPRELRNALKFDITDAGGKWPELRYAVRAYHIETGDLLWTTSALPSYELRERIKIKLRVPPMDPDSPFSFDNLPVDAWHQIFSRMPLKEVARLRRVSPLLRRIVNGYLPGFEHFTGKVKERALNHALSVSVSPTAINTIWVFLRTFFDPSLLRTPSPAPSLPLYRPSTLHQYIKTVAGLAFYEVAPHDYWPRLYRVTVYEWSGYERIERLLR